MFSRCLRPSSLGRLEVGHELAGVCAVDDAVIEAQGKALDRAIAMESLPSYPSDFGFLVQAADAEDGALRLVDDGGSELFAKDAGVGEGEGASRDLIRGEPLVAGRDRYINDAAGDAQEVLFFGLLQDRDDEAPVERNGDADVDVLVVADGGRLDGIR